MKNFFIIFTTWMLLSQCVLASNEQVDTNKQFNDGYREGLKAATEAKKNQEQWKQGKGAPKMAESYQEGLRSAAKAKKNEELWKQDKGNAEMAESYQKGLSGANDTQEKIKEAQN